MSIQGTSASGQEKKIEEALSKISADGSNFLNGGLDSRQKLVAGARQLLAAAETPVESLLWNIWALPTRYVAARVAVDLKIFETAVAEEGRPKTNDELASPTGASPTLVKRIARICVSIGMLDEQGPGLYKPNELTALLAKPEYSAGITFLFDCTAISFAKLPSYLREHQFQNPQNGTDGPFQKAHNHEGHAFHWLAAHPETFNHFHQYVHALRLHRPSWSDMYPVQERLIEGLKDGNASAFIDIGGGVGQVLQDFHASFPQFGGRLVLQEQPEVVAAAKAMGVDKDGRIELHAHDFFTPQPIKGARAYFMRSTLHDWPDEQCRVILKHLKDVMEPGYSKILVSDCVVADEQAAWQHLSLDMFMMAQASAQERTTSEWHALFEGCGLKIAGIYNKGPGNEGLIEVVLE